MFSRKQINSLALGIVVASCCSTNAACAETDNSAADTKAGESSAESKADKPSVETKARKPAAETKAVKLLSEEEKEDLIELWSQALNSSALESLKKTRTESELKGIFKKHLETWPNNQPGAADKQVQHAAKQLIERYLRFKMSSLKVALLAHKIVGLHIDRTKPSEQKVADLQKEGRQIMDEFNRCKAQLEEYTTLAAIARMTSRWNESSLRLDLTPKRKEEQYITLPAYVAKDVQLCAELAFGRDYEGALLLLDSLKLSDQQSIVQSRYIKALALNGSARYEESEVEYDWVIKNTTDPLLIQGAKTGLGLLEKQSSRLARSQFYFPTQETKTKTN